MKKLLVVLVLFISAHSFSQPDTVIYAQACFNYTFPSGNYSSNLPGQFQDTLIAADGSDSIISIVLNPVYFSNQETLLFEDGNLVAPPNLWSYQWIDCETGLTIPNENENVFSPTSNGSYAVVLNDVATCTTNCFVLENLNTEAYERLELTMYPNPTNGVFTMRFKDKSTKTVSIYNNLNEIVFKKKESKQEIALNLENQPTGIYLVKTTNDKGRFTFTKLVVQE